MIATKVGDYPFLNQPGAFVLLVMPSVSAFFATEFLICATCDALAAVGAMCLVHKRNFKLPKISLLSGISYESKILKSSIFCFLIFKIFSLLLRFFYHA